MQLKGLQRKDKKQVKALLSNLDFLGIRDFLVSRELYERHNRSELLLETLLFGDYQSAAELVEEHHLSTIDYIIISKFGDEYVFFQALNELADYLKPELSLCFLKNVEQAYMAEEKMFQVVKFRAFNEEFLKQLCACGNETLFEIFIDKCVRWRFESIYEWAVYYVADFLIREKIFTMLKILIEKTPLDERLVDKMNDDQFAWYAGWHQIRESSIKALVRDNRETKFKIVLKTQELSDALLKGCLFLPERFHFFTDYVEEKRLSEELERELFRRGMLRYRHVYLQRHKIGFWKKLEYFWN